MIIGQFTEYKGNYDGKITTLAIQADVRIEAQPVHGSKQPDFRLYANGIEIGAGWAKLSKKENRYVDIVLDDPSFHAPLRCRLMQNSEGSNILYWDR